MISAKFEKSKETKNKVRYEEDVLEGEAPHIGTLYIGKDAVKELGDPEKISVSVSAD